MKKQLIDDGILSVILKFITRKRTLVLLMSNNLTVRLKGISIILLFFFLYIINKLWWDHLSILINKKELKNTLMRVVEALVH